MSQVLGTSLTVYPFGMLPSLAPPLTPRVLLNQEPVGPFRKVSINNYRDVMSLGDCDVGVASLAECLGWGQELKTIASSLGVDPSYSVRKQP